MFRRLLAIVLSFVLAFVVLIAPAAIAADSTYYLPIAQGSESPAPDWSQVTFGSLPNLDGASTLVLSDPQLQGQIGYNISRSWLPGASLMNVMKVGDLEYFGIGAKAVGDFLGGTDPRQVALGAFSALNGVSLNELIEAIPELKNIPASSLPLAQSLFSGQWSSLPSQGVQLASNYFPEINQFMKDNPALANIPIGQIIQGDWQGALSQGAQIGIKELTKVAPQLANIPLGNIVGDITSGNFQGALSTGIDYGMKELAKSIPELKGLPAGEILGDLTSGNWKGALSTGWQYGSKYLLGDLAKKFPQLSNIPLGEVLNLNNMSLASVPGLAQTAISKIPGISNQSIGSIPGLGNVSVAEVLSLADLLKMQFAKVDFLDQAATQATYPLSGSTKDDQFKPEPCVGKCAHFEVQDSKSILGVTVKGRQWVTGDQKVPGGKGALAVANGGKEPTGLVPWGPKPNLKLVVTKVNDGKGSIDLALYYRICVKKLFVDLGCTPYFLGPIPFGSVSEKGSVLIATSAPPPSIPGVTDVGNILGDCTNGATLVSATSSPTKYGHQAYAEAKQGDLTTVSTSPSLPTSEYLQKNAASAFERMRQAAAQQGIDLEAVSGFRSVASQQQLWDAQVQRQGSEAEAAKISAPPGYSEHHTGYAIDIGAGSSTSLSAGFENTPTYQWLSQNAGNYGFEQSFTRTSTVGADNEPWHWRFVGIAQAKATFNPAPQQDPVAVGNQNLIQYLARLSVGESTNNTNIGPNPQTGAYGEFQFTPGTRALVLERTGLDPWSTDKSIRDKATLAWIDIYGKDQGVDLISAIKRGDFVTADQVLGKNQFTSLPSGAEQSNVWLNAANFIKYGPAGKGAGGVCGGVLASNSPAVPCPPGKPCVFYNPLPGSALTTPFGYIPSRGRRHWGVDLATTYDNTGPGSQIHAAWDGVIYDTPDYFGGQRNYGHRTEIYHPDRNLYTSYSHQYSRSIVRGNNIKRGQIIGIEGNTSGGMYTHLHYEIARHGSVPSAGSDPFDPISIPHEPPFK